LAIKRGDIYEVDWDPGRGSEQRGVRPSLVSQNDIANSVSAYRVTIVLAISSKIKNYPSTVTIEPTVENGLSVTSEVNTGQIMTIGKERLGRRIGSISDVDLQKVTAKLTRMVCT
jgi:mRNA interferase MazF